MLNWTKPNTDELRALLSVPFGLTRSLRDPSQLRRPRIGEIEGRRVWRFDLALNLRYDADGDSVSNNYSAGVAAMARRVDGRLALERRGLLRRPESAGLSEVTPPSETLSRVFRVRSSSPELAAELLSDEVCAWLTGPGKGWHFEIVHDRVLAYGWRRYVGGNGPVRAAVGLAGELERPAPPTAAANVVLATSQPVR